MSAARPGLSSANRLRLYGPTARQLRASERSPRVHNWSHTCGGALKLVAASRNQNTCSAPGSAVRSATRRNSLQFVRRDKMSDDAKFILGFG
jgi:hypothetical protein